MQTPFIFASNNNDIVLGKAQALPFPIPEDFELSTVHARKFEVWCTDSHNFYVSDAVKLQITSTGISVTGNANISGSVNVSQNAVIGGSATANEIISQNYSSGELELTFTEIYNAVTAINDILSRLQALEAQV